MELLDQPIRQNPTGYYFTHWRFRDFYIAFQVRGDFYEVLIFPYYSTFSTWTWRAATIDEVNHLLQRACAAIDNGSLGKIWTGHAKGSFKEDPKFLENLDQYALHRREKAYDIYVIEGDIKASQQLQVKKRKKLTIY